jgi:adenylate cyclase
MQRSPEIESRTREYYDALSRADAEAVAGFFTSRDGVTLIGTDPEEWWVGHSTIAKIWEAQLGEVGGIGVEGAEPMGYARGDVGWMADRPTLVLGGEMRIPLRITAVWEREDGTWKVAQWHASIGVPNDETFGEGITTQVDATA